MHFCVSQISYSQNMNRAAANCFWMMLRITSAHRRRDRSFYKYYVNIKKYYIKIYICIYRFFVNPNSSVFDRRVITESITDGATVRMTLCTRIVNSTLHRCLWWHTRKQIIFFVTDGFYQKEGCTWKSNAVRVVHARHVRDEPSYANSHTHNPVSVFIGSASGDERMGGGTVASLILFSNQSMCWRGTRGSTWDTSTQQLEYPDDHTSDSMQLWLNGDTTRSGIHWFSTRSAIRLNYSHDFTRTMRRTDTCLYTFNPLNPRNVAVELSIEFVIVSMAFHTQTKLHAWI